MIIGALVAQYKKQSKDYPQAAALGSLSAKFSSFCEYVTDLLDAIDADKSKEKIKREAALCRQFLVRLEEEAYPNVQA